MSTLVSLSPQIWWSGQEPRGQTWPDWRAPHSIITHWSKLKLYRGHFNTWPSTTDSNKLQYSLRQKETGANLVQTGLRWWFGQQRFRLQCRRRRFDPWVRKKPWRREWLPTPGEFYGQRSPADSSPWGHKESDTTERLTLSLTFLFQIGIYVIIISHLHMITIWLHFCKWS